MSITTPIAFIIFNRPDLTEIVFERIREAQPKKLLVIADGPRSVEEADKCEQARAIINKVDWNCEVLTNFSKQNFGCRKRVSDGLNWVFSEVEEAIVLEDDCLPTSSFFYFCQTLLEYYRQDERIMMISGDNFQGIQRRVPYSYYFSKYSHVWGWASWRRAWKHYDVEMRTWQEFKKQNWIVSICEETHEQEFWTRIFDRVSNGEIDTWDYQWTYACWRQSGLTVLPCFNLISNIGFREDATHTIENSPLANLPTTDIWDIHHPSTVIRCKEADTYTFEYAYDGQNLRKKNSFLEKISRFIKNGDKLSYQV